MLKAKQSNVKIFIVILFFSLVSTVLSPSSTARFSFWAEPQDKLAVSPVLYDFKSLLNGIILITIGLY